MAVLLSSCPVCRRKPLRSHILVRKFHHVVLVVVAVPPAPGAVGILPLLLDFQRCWNSAIAVEIPALSVFCHCCWNSSAVGLLPLLLESPTWNSGRILPLRKGSPIVLKLLFPHGRSAGYSLWGRTFSLEIVSMSDMLSYFRRKVLGLSWNCSVLLRWPSWLDRNHFSQDLAKFRFWWNSGKTFRRCHLSRWSSSCVTSSRFKMAAVAVLTARRHVTANWIRDLRMLLASGFFKMSLLMKVVRSPKYSLHTLCRHSWVCLGGPYPDLDTVTFWYFLEKTWRLFRRNSVSPQNGKTFSQKIGG